MGMAGKDSGTRGRYPKCLRDIFKAVVQALLLFGSEMWVLTPLMGQDLGIFHHRVARRITWGGANQQEYGVWDYTPLETEM